MKSFVTMITPYKPDGSIDFKTAEKYVELYYNSGLIGTPSEHYNVFFRKFGDEKFSFYKKTQICECEIENLNENEDYEFFVETTYKKKQSSHGQMR